MILFIFIIIALTLSPAAFAEYSGGIIFDTSSNMLMVPGGESGLYTIAYGEYRVYPSERLMATYRIAGGLLERYDGLQYQRHELSAWYDLVLGEKLEWSVSADAGLSRFGDVTAIDGYNTGTMQTHIRSYIFPTVLLRWEGGAGLRSYRSFTSENYYEAESSLRLDKFLKSRTTVRLQLDTGIRRYHDLESEPSTSLSIFSTRIAQSFGKYTGISVEGSVSSLDSGSDGSTESNVFNRIFLDDHYKYAHKGMEVQLRRTIPEKGAVTLKGFYNKRDYGEGSPENYSYLPENGWTETERGTSLMLAYSFKFLPAYLHPSVELYYIDVKASESYLSYKATGLSLRFALL